MPFTALQQHQQTYHTMQRQGYRTSHAVYGIATLRRVTSEDKKPEISYRTSHAVYGIATFEYHAYRNGLTDRSYRTSHAVYGIATEYAIFDSVTAKLELQD